MTENPIESAPAAQSPSQDKTGDLAGKAFWVGMGIGSAALVAALMYARRPKRGR